MAPPSDDLLQEVIAVVRDNTDRLAEYRNSVNTAMVQVYQRIVAIEKRLDHEARKRPERQKELDAKLRKLTEANEKIGGRLDAQDATLEAQDQTLDTIYRAQWWRGVVQVAIVVLLALIAGVLLWHYFGS